MNVTLSATMEKKGNQFAAVDGQLPILDLWRWWCVADRSVGTLRVESFLSSPQCQEPVAPSAVQFLTLVFLG